jgi:hypothetical protein
MGMKEDLITWARTLEQESDAAVDLWSWLPSYKAAQACHGDYAYDHRPSIADIMREAAMYLAHLKGYDKSDDQKEGWFECPCGECERPNSCADCDLFAHSLMRCRAVEDAQHCDEGRPHEKCPFIRGNGGLVQKP